MSETTAQRKRERERDEPSVVTCQLLHLSHALLDIFREKRDVSNDVDSHGVSIEKLTFGDERVGREAERVSDDETNADQKKEEEKSNSSTHPCNASSWNRPLAISINPLTSSGGLEKFSIEKTKMVTHSMFSRRQTSRTCSPILHVDGHRVSFELERNRTTFPDPTSMNRGVTDVLETLEALLVPFNHPPVPEFGEPPVSVHHESDMFGYRT